MIGAGKSKRISRQIAADSKQTVSVSDGRPLDDRNKTVTLTDDESMSAASPSRDEDPAVLINSGILVKPTSLRRPRRSPAHLLVPPCWCSQTFTLPHPSKCECHQTRFQILPPRD